jgi:hypothetical protein
MRIHIYSDHSTRSGKTGIGVVIPYYKISLFKEVPEIKNAYKAECLAFKHAILLAKKLGIKSPKFKIDHTGLVRNYLAGLRRDGLEVEDGLQVEAIKGEDNYADSIARGQNPPIGFKHIKI